MRTCLLGLVLALSSSPAFAFHHDGLLSRLLHHRCHGCSSCSTCDESWLSYGTGCNCVTAETAAPATSDCGCSTCDSGHHHVRHHNPPYAYGIVGSYAYYAPSVYAPPGNWGTYGYANYGYANSGYANYGYPPPTAYGPTGYTYATYGYSPWPYQGYAAWPAYAAPIQAAWGNGWYPSYGDVSGFVPPAKK